MKNVVTPETARKLKEAGFRQPSYSMCQIWYDPNGMKWIRMMPSYWTNPENGFTVDNANFKLAAFAPTATDILAELKGEYFLDFDAETEEFFALKSVGAAFKFSNKKGCEALADAYFRMVENDGIE